MHVLGLAVFVWAILAMLDEDLHPAYELVGLVLAVMVAIRVFSAIAQ